MSKLDRRRFLCSAVTVGAIGSVSGVTGYQGEATSTGWEWLGRGRSFSTVGNARTVDDGYLLTGTTSDGIDPSAGWAVKLTPSGDVSWDQQYQSPSQLEALDQEIMGPIPQDGLSFSLPAPDGNLLVGWTYFDNTAAYVGRLVRTDSNGTVEWERSFSDLENASAYSYLEDGVQTDDGYILCGIESPGIMLGGAGWLVSVAADGSVLDHKRIPATDRDIENTGRSDVFTSMIPTANGYVLSGSYQPDDSGQSRAWMVGLDDALEVRWDDRFDLGTGEPTRAYEVVASDSDAYDFIVVGGSGPRIDRGRRDYNQPREPGVDGEGFVAAYTDDGERVWLDRYDGTPLFCAERGPHGVTTGGSRNGRGWVGALERTDFESDHESSVTSLCESHEGGLVAVGRRIAGDRTEGWAKLIDGDDDDDHEQNGDERDEPAEADDEKTKNDREEMEPDDQENADDEERKDEPEDETTDEDDPDDDQEEDPDTDPEPSIEFIDCETVRVTGTVADVMFALTWWSEEGMVGTITEPVGGVDGERTISATEEFGSFAYGPLLNSVETFEETPATPGLGTYSMQNPHEEACREELFAQLEADGIDPEGQTGESDGSGGDGDGDEEDDTDDTTERDEDSTESETDEEQTAETDDQEAESEAGEETGETDTDTETTDSPDGDSESTTGNESTSD